MEDNRITEEIIESINNRDLSVIKKYNRMGFTLDNIVEGSIPIIFAYNIGFHEAWKLIIDGGTTINVYNGRIGSISPEIFLYFVEKGLDPKSKLDGVPIIMRANYLVILHYLSIKEMDVFDVKTDDNLSIMGYRQIVKKEFMPYVTYDDLLVLYEVLDEKNIDLLIENKFALNPKILFNTGINRCAYMRRLPPMKNIGIPIRNKRELIAFYNTGYDFGVHDIVWLIKNNPNIELLNDMIVHMKNPNLEDLTLTNGKIEIFDFVLKYGGKISQSTIEKAVKTNNVELLNVFSKYNISLVENDES